ncbi:hypothetical protein SKAU_G00006040 [Synaphobranchus kaupii]|uniref:Uncharacterized protein n=1 Tax=Synaphobranchus kaupii TaxID=118154 RepID=A0A9Q1JAR3_SYNKA|nr:hypothetical protein SKAU_G00006040 [Synaphobranchus kaupii]
MEIQVRLRGFDDTLCLDSHRHVILNPVGIPGPMCLVRAEPEQNPGCHGNSVDLSPRGRHPFALASETSDSHGKWSRMSPRQPGDAGDKEQGHACRSLR